MQTYYNVDRELGTLIQILLFGKLTEHELNLSSMKNSVQYRYKFV